MSELTDHASEIITVYSSTDVAGVPRVESGRLKLMVLAHWQAGVTVNKHADRVEEATLGWFRKLGFGEREICKVKTFKPSHYVGIPFPHAGYHETLLISKYLSLWLLWDDVAIENDAGGWTLDAHDVFSYDAPTPATRFERAWLCLFRELTETMSQRWVATLCEVMAAWSSAAVKEAALSARWNSGRARVSFADALKSRIDTIGMYATSYLLEYAASFELPESFHTHPRVQRIKLLANQIVGLGNDIFSLGKDYALGYINVILALKRERAISMSEALCMAAKIHNDTMAQYDLLAGSLPSFGPQEDARIAQWLQSLRHCCLGFTLWESAAPRYKEHRLLVNGILLEPSFFMTPPRSRCEHRSLVPRTLTYRYPDHTAVQLRTR